MHRDTIVGKWCHNRWKKAASSHVGDAAAEIFSASARIWAGTALCRCERTVSFVTLPWLGFRSRLKHRHTTTTWSSGSAPIIGLSEESALCGQQISIILLEEITAAFQDVEPLKGIDISGSTIWCGRKRVVETNRKNLRRNQAILNEINSKSTITVLYKSVIPWITTKLLKTPYISLFLYGIHHHVLYPALLFAHVTAKNIPSNDAFKQIAEAQHWIR